MIKLCVCSFYPVYNTCWRQFLGESWEEQVAEANNWEILPRHYLKTQSFAFAEFTFCTSAASLRHDCKLYFPNN